MTYGFEAHGQKRKNDMAYDAATHWINSAKFFCKREAEVSQRERWGQWEGNCHLVVSGSGRE
jgi:4-diphosphocytidyl-2C-methyl-D-erythritol kinase